MKKLMVPPTGLEPVAFCFAALPSLSIKRWSFAAFLRPSFIGPAKALR
jgi:hypothetical protein